MFRWQLEQAASIARFVDAAFGPRSCAVLAVTARLGWEESGLGLSEPVAVIIISILLMRIEKVNYQNNTNSL